MGQFNRECWTDDLQYQQFLCTEFSITLAVHISSWQKALLKMLKLLLICSTWGSWYLRSWTEGRKFICSMPKVRTKASEGKLGFPNPVLHREHKKIFSIRSFFQPGAFFFFIHVSILVLPQTFKHRKKKMVFVQFIFTIIKSNMKT